MPRWGEKGGGRVGLFSENVRGSQMKQARYLGGVAWHRAEPVVAEVGER